MANIKIEFTSEIVESYKRLSYKPWFALAEYVDNSTQAYFNNKKILKEVYAKNDTKLSVEITYHKGDILEEDYIIIYDNSIGMDEDDLKRAFLIGTPPENNSGRSRYGLGMKTASFWFGDNWSITTKKYNSKSEFTVDLDVKSIAGNELNIEVVPNEIDEKEHYTQITIYNLHRRYKGRTISKIKSYLASIYRFDISRGLLDLFWNGEKLEWHGYVPSDFIEDHEGKPQVRNFVFKLDKKRVKGWAGILKSGSRTKGGFSLIQSYRIIQSPPNGYKPESIFGVQEGGTNDLINQRVVGELFLYGFEVSHTKDSILWQGTEEDDLDEAILEQIGDFKKLAKKPKKEDDPNFDNNFKFAFYEVLKEFETGEAIDIVNDDTILPPELIKASNDQLEATTIKTVEPTLIQLGNLIVKLYIDENMSINDPYVINNSLSNKDVVIVIVNKNHPFWYELRNELSIRNYLRQCVYDAVAEWKANFKIGSIQPETIKHIKDDLMRIPYTIASKN